MGIMERQLYQIPYVGTGEQSSSAAMAVTQEHPGITKIMCSRICEADLYCLGYNIR